MRLSIRVLVAIAATIAGGPLLVIVALEGCLLTGRSFSPSLIEYVVANWLAPRLLVGLLVSAVVSAVCWLARSRYKRGCVAATAGFAALFLACQLGLAFLFAVALRHGEQRYARVVLHATRFSDGYTESGFRAVEVGWARDRVLQIAGQPLRSFRREGGEVLVYSDIGSYRSRASKAYHQRWIVVTSGRVARVLRRVITTEMDPLS